MSSYDEHLISMAGGDEHADTVLTLLALVRKQQAKLAAVERWTAKFEAAESSDIAKRENAQFDLGYSAGRRSAGSILRRALEPTL